jgi:uncharacterized protein
MDRDTRRTASRRVASGPRRRQPGALPPLIRALCDPAAYPEPRPAAVELRQTHISYVLLAGERVYKIKKAVDLGFLDYSTPARRAYYCRREVTLNRRFAPDVYLGVVPIVERGDAVGAGGRGRKVERAVRVGGHGRGRVVERAVVMRRLPADGMLPHLLATGAVTAALVAQIARQIAAFHALADAGPRVSRFGRPGAVRHTVQSNLARCAPYVGRTLDAATFAHLQAWTATFLREHPALLQRRVAERRIRDGHGDLHAASICLLPPAADGGSSAAANRPPASPVAQGDSPALDDTRYPPSFHPSSPGVQGGSPAGGLGDVPQLPYVHS